MLILGTEAERPAVIQTQTKEDEFMKKNIGGVDRVVRIIAGLGILSLAFIGPQSPWAYLGIVPLATGLVGWCPPYALFGFSTCKNCK
jgi:hypothetical protein